MMSEDFSSTSPAGPYGRIDEAKKVFSDYTAEAVKSQGLLDRQKLAGLIESYNSSSTKSEDPIDHFLSALPSTYRLHFTMVHRSFSPQKATPQAPRVILFGPDSKVIMAFNSTDPSIELIEWNGEKTQWDFSELNFKEGQIVRENNPAKCIMCHAGTPKPLDTKNREVFSKALKPIFPQYPFWPGFYGSANDIVGLKQPGSRDTIMLNLNDTVKQVKSLTFDSTEELFRLRHLLDTNPKYLDLIRTELKVHRENFEPLMASLKSRPRYRQLMTLKDVFQNQGKKVPAYLEAAPYRRTFDKEYGNYLLRPNFYFSSLLTFYHAQYIAKQIEKNPLFEKIKFSFLARKYNCGNITSGDLSLKELDPSFDLFYPNQSTQESRDKQYLLAYQYNVVAAAKGGPAALPLHAWNLESNEDIASYHYGNVYSDLNEIVLWNLAIHAFPELKPSHARSAAENRHYDLGSSNYFKQFLEGAGGFVSRMGNKEIKFASSDNSYYGTATKFKALPVSGYCDKLFVPAAKNEMQKIAEMKKANALPHQIYKLDARLYTLDEITPREKTTTSMVKMACEGCHVSPAVNPLSAGLQPQLNVDWYSQSYPKDLRDPVTSLMKPQGAAVEYKDLLLEVLSKEALPVPYGNRMPYGRRPLGNLAEQCERLITQNAYQNTGAPKMSVLLGCSKESDPQSLGCRCKKLVAQQHTLYKEFYKDTDK